MQLIVCVTAENKAIVREAKATEKRSRKKLEDIQDKMKVLYM